MRWSTSFEEDFDWESRNFLSYSGKEMITEWEFTTQLGRKGSHSSQNFKNKVKKKKEAQENHIKHTQSLFRTSPGSYHIYSRPQSFQQHKVSQVLLLVETEVSQALLTVESNFEAPQTS